MPQHVSSWTVPRQPTKDSADPELPVPISKWQQFERDVAVIYESMDDGATVTWNAMKLGRLSGVDRQVDVLIEGEYNEEPIEIAVECKHYAKPVGIGVVDQFSGMLADIGVDRGVLYTVNGFTEPAKARAKGQTQPRISPRVLHLAAPTPDDFDDVFSGFGDCPNTNCYTGDISWMSFGSAGGDAIDFGHCDTCGSSAVRCTECEDITAADEVCWCGTTYRLTYDRKGSEVEGVVRSNEDGTETEFDEAPMIDHPMH